MAENVKAPRPLISREGIVTYKGETIGKVTKRGLARYEAFDKAGSYVGFSGLQTASMDALAVRFDVERLATDGLVGGTES